MVHEPSVGSDNRFRPQVILFYPTQAMAGQCGYLVFDQGFQPDITAVDYTYLLIPGTPAPIL